MYGRGRIIADKKLKIKTLKFRPNIAQHDLNVKIKALKKFLDKEKKVRVVITFKGREMKMTNVGLEMIQEIARNILDLATADSKPSLKGNSMSVVFTPKKKQA